ncbi:MAG: hypothetical protein Q4C04_06150 [Clostridia bacterium]|nr:hypothetical protein [Clostridia bacterium]
MLEIREVKTRAEQRAFLNFPLKLYKDCPYFVPPLYGDEKKMFRPDYVYYDTCDTVFFNAYRDGRQTGRIQGIIQRAANEKNGEKRARFTRFDSINDAETAEALFSAVENWAKSKGMNAVHGPLGFSDLEREGLLIEGFSELSTFEEQYSYDYYPALIEGRGYCKEVDWVERKVFKPDKPDPRFKELSNYLLKRHKLHFGEAKNTREFIELYGDKIFELLDISYKDIYGTVPFTDGMKRMLIGNFKLMINLKQVAVILDENERAVCFGVCFPSIARAVQPSGGRLTPLALIRILRAVKRPRIIDLGLVGVLPEYAQTGVSSAIISGVVDILNQESVEYAETNLNLEDNYNIQNQWKRFKTVVHKRRRAYVKYLNGENKDD